MALLNILQFPDVRLKKVATPVQTFDAALKNTVGDMFDTLYESRGVGLAATQVNIHQRIIVLDLSETGNEPLTLINPTIIEQSGQFESDEGCLSFPSVFAKVKRYEDIEITYFDEDGHQQTLVANGGLLSACIQHEMDHLQGITFFDHLSLLKQSLLIKKLQKNQKRAL